MSLVNRLRLRSKCNADELKKVERNINTLTFFWEDESDEKVTKLAKIIP
jgi:phage/plasmid-associated DNA primase